MNAVLEERSAVVPLERVEPSRVALPAPATPAELAGHYDLTISHPEVEATAFKAFDGWLAQEAAELGLSCALLHDRTVREAAARLAAGEMTIGFHLDYFALWHRLHDPYARLAEAIEDAGGRSVNSPARAALLPTRRPRTASSTSMAWVCRRASFFGPALPSAR